MVSTPLTPAVITKLPLGLLSFFGIKNGGQYPRTISPEIVAQLDMGGLLQANYIERRVGSINVTASGFQPFNAGAPLTGLLTVPNGEVWCMSACTFIVSTGAGDAVAGNLAVRNLQDETASFWYRALTGVVTQGASQVTANPIALGGEPIWLSPRDTFGMNVATFTVAAAITVSANIGFTRFAF